MAILRRIGLLALLASLVSLAACATRQSAIAVETDACEAVSAARHVAYWMSVDVGNVRNPDPATAEEIARLRAVGARLSAQADALEQELDAATVARMERKSTNFMERGAFQTRTLREQTLQARTQWEQFLARLDAEDAAERPSSTPEGESSPAWDPPRPGRAAR